MTNVNEQVNKQEVLDALSRVEDGGQDVVRQGRIQGVDIKDGHVRFALTVNADEGAAKEPLRLACEEAVRAIEGVSGVTAVLTAERVAQSPNQGAQDQPLRKPSALDAPKKSGVGNVGAIIAVASGKGGVGKSTTAVNLALALSRMGMKVGLLDTDVFGPSIPRMMGISGKPSSDGKKIIPHENFGIKCMSIGFMVDEDAAMIWRGPMVMSAIQQMLNDVDWGALDILVLDLPPGTGDAQLTIAQQVPLTGAVIVSTPQDIALLDARRGISMFEKVDVPTLGIIENMSYFVCPDCGSRSHIFGHGGARETAEKLKADFLGEIPLDIAIRETSDSGEPIVVSQPDSEHALCYLDIAAQIAGKIDQARGEETAAPKIVFD